MYEEILKFWFEEVSSQQHFQKDPAFDQMIIKRFAAIHQKASRAELYNWRKNITGRLAEVIILDQFSRNMFRKKAASFAYDGMALILAQEAIATKQVQELTIEQQAFLYMPFMHSESLVIHQTALELFSQPGLEDYLAFEKKHQAIIARFGRYPHRNTILNRQSTKAELEFLTQPGSSF